MKKFKKILALVLAIGMVFAAMFNIVGAFYGTDKEIIVTAGIVNNVIQFFGGEPINWINYGSSYAANMAVMVIYIVWNALPFKILILTSALASVIIQKFPASPSGKMSFCCLIQLLKRKRLQSVLYWVLLVKRLF